MDKGKREPLLFAISGVKNSGKTTLITKLIPILKGKGLKVATIKHDGHDFAPDVPGTDTDLHHRAGAYGTAVFSEQRFMVVKETSGITEQELKEQFPEADLILLEGFKHSSYPKMELVRSGNSTEPVCKPEQLLAVLSDFVPECEPDVPVMDLNDTEKIAEFLWLYWYAYANISLVVLAGGESNRMGSNKADLLYLGRTFLENQVEKGKKLGITDVVASGYYGRKTALPVVMDRCKKRGPLGGMEASFRVLKNKRTLVLGVDIPQVPLAELKRLIYFSMERKEKAVVLQHNGKVEPLIGLYDTDLSDIIEVELLQKKGSVMALLQEIGYAVYESSAPEECFSNINDKTAYMELRSRGRQSWQ